MNIGLRFPAEIDIISMLSVVPSTEDFPALLQHMAWWDEQTLPHMMSRGDCAGCAASPACRWLSVIKAFYRFVFCFDHWFASTSQSSSLPGSKQLSRKPNAMKGNTKFIPRMSYVRSGRIKGKRRTLLSCVQIPSWTLASIVRERIRNHGFRTQKKRGNWQAARQAGLLRCGWFAMPNM